MSRPRLGELLVSGRVITQAQLDQALLEPRTPGKRLGEFLVERGLVSETQVTQILGQQLSVPWVSLYHIDFSRQLLNLVPREVAERFCLVPIYVRRVRKQGETLYVAMDDPTNDAALAEVSKHAGLPTQPMIACPSDIRSAIRVYYGAGESPAAPAQPSPSENLSPIARSRSSAPPRPPAGPVPPPPATADHPDAEPEIEAKEVPVRRKPPRAMVAVTMLDGTKIHVPARGGEEATPSSDGTMTARDLVRALEGIAAGKAQNDLGFEVPRWEELFAALLSVLLRKGLVGDWEYIEELKKLKAAAHATK